jgi:GLPGLI family protein
MKKILLALFLFPVLAFSQPILSGKIKYLKTSNWTKQMAAVDYLTSQQKERAAYVWGNRAEWKQYCELFFDENHSRYIDSDEKAEPDDEGYSWRADAYCITRDFSTNRQADLMTLLGKVYLVEDSIYTPKWKILNDIKEVAGHICMNASAYDTLRMQRIEAWFALDMPASVGPERFCGLPGAILEININNGGMILTAEKIDLRPLNLGELDLPAKPKRKKINEKTYLEKLAEHFRIKKEAEEMPFWGIRY